MKKIRFSLLVFFALLAIGNNVEAQNTAQAPPGTYSLTLEITYLRNSSSNMRQFRFRTYTAEHEFFHWTAGRVLGGRSIPIDNRGPVTHVHQTRPPAINFYSWRQWNIFLSWLGGTRSSYQNNTFTIDRNRPYIRNQIITTGNNGRDVFHPNRSELRMSLLPTNIRFYTASNAPINMAQLFPENTPRTIRASSGFHSSIYTWEYSLDNGGNWNPFPPQMQNRSEITLNSTFFFPTTEAFKEAVINNRSIWVRVNAPTYENINGGRLEHVTLNPILSAPHILRAQIEEQETTFEADDARVRIFFDRALYDGELINIEIDAGGGSYLDPINANIETLDNNNSVVVYLVPSRRVVFFVISRYLNGYLFNEAESHFYEYTVFPRSPVEHTVTIQHILCYGGTGQITVTAFGGVEDYTARLYTIDNVFREQFDFLRSGSAVFSNLPAGEYRVRVRDRNQGQSLRYDAIYRVEAPAAPLAVYLEYSRVPSAYDSRDGEVTIGVSGGTQNNTGGHRYAVRLLHTESGREYFPLPNSESYDGNGVFLYTFTGLGGGDYTVIVTDANNCKASYPIPLIAPLPLIVYIEETRFIHWYGGNQGELTARASGGVPFPIHRLPYDFTWYRKEFGVWEPLSVPNDSIVGGLISGYYRVRIMDSNLVESYATYFLEQPYPLTAAFTVVHTACPGDRSGSIVAEISGGTAPFTFAWNVEDATENTLTSLAAGTYTLFVTDARGGRETFRVEVEAASYLIVDSLVVQPTCLALGSITLTLSGAAAPYTVRWTDMPTDITLAADETMTREDLTPGIYVVEITDSNECVSIFYFYLEAPRSFTVSLGDDIVMNRHQSRLLEALSDEPNLTYVWYFNDARLPDTGSSILIDREGEFSVIATNEQGCTATDRVSVRMTNYVLELDMTVPTKVEIGFPVHAVNLSTMAADRIEWILPEGVTIIEQSDTRLVFRFNELGSHTISMEGFRGEGATIVTRTIEVVGAGEVELPEGSLIRQFWASPNPSTGQFRVQVELNEPGDFTMRLYSPEGVLMDTREGRNVESQTFDYEIAGVLQGTFVLHLITSVDRSVLQVVIRR